MSEASALVERTLALAQEMKLAMGGRTSDPVNPNFLTAASAIAIYEDQCTHVRNTALLTGDPVLTTEGVLAQYREGYADAIRMVLANLDLDPADKERLEKALDGEAILSDPEPGA